MVRVARGGRVIVAVMRGIGVVPPAVPYEVRQVRFLNVKTVRD